MRGCGGGGGILRTSEGGEEGGYRVRQRVGRKGERHTEYVRGWGGWGILSTSEGGEEGGEGY